MKCLRKVKTTNAQFQNGTFSGFLTFEMDSSPIVFSGFRLTQNESLPKRS